MMEGIKQNMTRVDDQEQQASHRRMDEAEFNQLSIEVTNIQDQAGFKKKVQSKLDQLIDPKNIQIFSMDQSKHLYKVVTKHADKEKER